MKHKNFGLVVKIKETLPDNHVKVTNTNIRILVSLLM